MLAAIHDGKEKGANRNNSPAGWIRVLVESSAGSQRTHATGKSAQSRTILCDGFIISVVTSLRGFVSSQSTSNVSSFRVVLFVSKEGRGKGRGEKKNWKIGPIKSRRGNERLELVGKDVHACYVRIVWRRFKLDDRFIRFVEYFSICWNIRRIIPCHSCLRTEMYSDEIFINLLVTDIEQRIQTCIINTLHNSYIRKALYYISFFKHHRIDVNIYITLY